jgi:D-alanyl-D-alanine carboxypeptidase
MRRFRRRSGIIAASPNYWFVRPLISFVMLTGLAGSYLASSGTAEARHRHHGYAGHHYHRHFAQNSGGYSPPYSEIVYDVNAGKVLTATNPDALRHPASITKVMTLYLLFEQLERGKLTLDSDLDVSSHAAAQSPSKLGLRPGSTIEVEDAIRAIVTRSANDVAVTIGENIAGSEPAFAELMTNKAHALGMSRTTFRNASGLPNAEQFTTARDLVVLGRAVQERFPQYYRYFSTRSFEYRGQVIGNHNHLLGRIEGVDGIKTGYTRDSGFNLLTSAKSNGRRVIAVVLGGRSGRQRDDQVASLLEEHMPEAATAGRHVVQVAENESDSEDNAPREKIAAPAKPAERPKPAVVAEFTKQRPDSQETSPAPRGNGRVGQVPKKTNLSGSTSGRSTSEEKTAATTPAGPSMRWVAGARSMAQADAKGQPADPATRKAMGLRSQAEEAQMTTASIAPKADAKEKVEAAPEARISAARIEPGKGEPSKPEPGKADPGRAEPVAAAHSGWIIQLAATEDEQQARALLADAKSKNRNLLASAESFTEKVQKGKSTLYRARFAGFQGETAEAACKILKHAGYNCFAQHI